MTDEQFSKLPKYVQDELQQARRRTARLQEELAGLRGEKQTRIHYPSDKGLWSESDDRHYLDPLETVRFIFDDDFDVEHPRRYLDVRLRTESALHPTRLEIHGSRRLIVLPVAANSILVDVEDQ